MGKTDEEMPLVQKQGEDALKEMELGPKSSGFASALQLAVRASVMMCLLGAIVWVPAIRKPFPNQVQARISLVICLFVFTINPLLGTAVQNAFCGIIGTFWACLHMWVMNGIFPGGMKEGMSPTSACAIFGWANFLIFLFVILACNCGIGTKMFALATDIGFMLAFLDPKSTVPFSENFTISHRGTAVNVMLATIIGCLAAPLMNLLPYPMDSAYASMKGAAANASNHAATLFEAIIDYYAGHQSSVLVEGHVKHAGALRAELDGMGAAIGGAYWECLDIGTPGTVRAFMGAHLTLMNDVYDRLRAILIVAQTEDFGDTHKEVMTAKLHKAANEVATVTKDLLIEATHSAADGNIDGGEKEKLEGKAKNVKNAVKGLATAFNEARGSKKVDKSLGGENYFVLTISAYARLVIDYSEMLTGQPPTSEGFGAAIIGGIKGTFDVSAMTSKNNIFFTMQHFLALVFCWLYSVYVDNWAGGCVITAVFLISKNVCPDIQAFLNVLNAVILAVVLGTLVFQWSCGTGFGDYLLPFAALLLWTVGLYGYFAKSVFLLPCLVFVALTPFRWVTSCPTGDISAGARALWGGMVANILAILFVCSFQFFLSVDRANRLATDKLNDAFNGLRDGFNSFWKHEDATGPMGGVAGACGDGSGYCASAAIEPRMWRNLWKDKLYTEIVAHVQTIRLDILMLWKAMEGSPKSSAEGIFDKFNGDDATKKTFEKVKADLNGTLEDAQTLAIEMLNHETGHFTGLSKIKTHEGIDELGDLDDLVGYLNKTSLAKDEDSMEDDEFCQVSTIVFLLDSTTKHIAALLKTAIRQV